MSRRGLAGLLLVVLGVMFLLDTTDVFGDDSRIFATYWPALLIGWGAWGLFLKDGLGRLGGRRGQVLFPTIVLVLGAVFLLSSLGVLVLGMGQLWPVILVVLGLWLVFRSRSRLFGRRANRTRLTRGRNISGDHWEVSYVFGGGKEIITSQEFSGGSVSAIFGGVEIDLREAGLAGGEATIDATAIFGGIELRVPADWRVNLRVTTLLGGTENKRHQPSVAEATGELTITGSVVFGGIQVKE